MKWITAPSKKTEKRLGLVSDFLEKKKIPPLKY